MARVPPFLATDATGLRNVGAAADRIGPLCLRRAAARV